MAEVSVIICTRNRPDKIPTAVRTVLGNRHPSFDLTIIDQSTSDDTRQAIAELIDGDERVRYVHTDQAGLSRAYNRGIAESTGPLLAFTDDDCVVAPDWIDSIVAAFADADGSLLYGQVEPFGEGDQMLAETPYLFVDRPQRLSKEDGFFVIGMGANFAARRELFETVGPFDEILGGGGPLKSSQDFDMTFRTYRAGQAVLVRPDVVIRHDGHRAAEDWPALLGNYGFGDGAFYMKHVRCRDGYAAWLMAKRLGHSLLRLTKDVVTGKGAGEWNYFRGALQGARGSFRYGVDRQRRLYVER